MVRDTLDSHRIIGMVQILPGHEEEQLFSPPVREVGCAGVIARHSELEDGRFLIWLLGVERFRIRQELRTLTRYRLASIRHESAPSASKPDGLTLKRLTLLASMTVLLDGRMEGGEEAVNGLVRQLGRVEDEPLAAAAAQILGLSGEVKQRLLEAGGPEERFDLLRMEFDRRLQGPRHLLAFTPKTFN
jgi:Lon protease-like protein